jgi:hydroxymethylpyrimidine/phosphomethylpyrimidine kinase
MPSLPRFVLTFAASDPTGGAGLQADLLTLASMGCHPLSVVTGITVQDTSGVDALLPMTAQWVTDQARSLLAEFPVAAFKLGALGSPENAEAVARILADFPAVPMVLDPVLASARGDALSAGSVVDVLRELILPRALLTTPNSNEVRKLAAAEGETSAMSLEACARRLLAFGCRHVLVTGTHEDTPQVVNTLYSASGETREQRWERLPGSYHGSGCTLASAIAARLAGGAGVADAVSEAQEFTWRALAAGYRPGSGQFLPDRFFWARSFGGQSR